MSAYNFLLTPQCTTTKLIQCRDFGVNSVEESRKFDKRPEDVPDLGVEDFLARRKVLKQVEAWCKSVQGNPEKRPNNQWKLILYQCEVCSCDSI